MIKLNVDCLSLIFNELQTDKKSLHSCLLVNKEWCYLIVPILWKKYPWYHDYESEKKLFNTILYCLPSTSKQFLSDNNIKLPSTILSKPPLFNYISFCKFLEAEIIDRIIKMVFEEEFNTGKHDKINLLEQEIYKLFVSQCNNIKELQWKTSQHLSLFPGATTCFSQLCSLCIDIDFVNSNALDGMAQICKDLNELTIYNCSQDLPGLVSLMDAQRNLKYIIIYSCIKKKTCKELSKTLARKGNTINYLHVGSISIIPPIFLTSLINLKNISIYNGEKYEDIRDEIKEFQQYLTISKFPDLQSLDVEGLSCFKELAMLVEKTEGNILLVFIYTTNKSAENTGMLVKAISNKCPKIERLSTHLEPKDFIHVKSLLLNCRNLVYLEFESLNFIVNDNNNNNNIGDELLDILAKFSPKSLTDITVSGDWKYSIDAFQRFFESCRERTLIYFGVICYNNYHITEDHKIIVRKYINEKVIKESNCV